MVLAAGVLPFQEGAKSGAAMAVFSFFFGAQLGKGLADLRKIKERIVAEAVRTTRGMKNDAFRFSVEGLQSVTVAGSGDHADKPPGTVFVGNIVQFAQQPCVV